MDKPTGSWLALWRLDVSIVLTDHLKHAGTGGGLKLVFKGKSLAHLLNSGGQERPACSSGHSSSCMRPPCSGTRH